MLHTVSIILFLFQRTQAVPLISSSVASVCVSTRQRLATVAGIVAMVRTNPATFVVT